MEYNILLRDIESFNKKRDALLGPTEEEHVLQMASYDVTEAKLQEEIKRF